MTTLCSIRKRLLFSGVFLLSVVGVASVQAQPIASIEVEVVSPRDLAVSVDPIYDTVASGLHAVGVGQKVYLRGVPHGDAVIGGYQWAITTAPASSVAASLSASSGEVVVFVSDVTGSYTVTLTPLDGAMEPTTPVNQVIYASTWAGAGVFEGTVGFPECARCHTTNSQDRLNKVDDWLATGHANTLQLHLAGFYGESLTISQLPYHTLGFDTATSAVNNGFDDRAAANGYNLQNVIDLVSTAATTGVDQWGNLPDFLKSHASVQCESCHGAGSVHPANRPQPDKGTAGVDLSGRSCAQCHDMAPGGAMQQYFQWENSAHPLAAEAAHNTSCLKCHSAEGFVEITVKGGTYAPGPDEHPHGITCVACHDPHKRDFPSQVRLAGPTAITSGHVYENAGQGGLCVACHNSRVVDPETTALGSFRGVHNSPQADMVMGVNGSDFGLPFWGNSAHTTIVKDTCVTCHMAPSPAGAGGNKPQVGEHSFAMRDEGGMINANNACFTCHSDLAGTYNKHARGDYDGNGIVEGVQTEVVGLFNILSPLLLELPGTSINSDGVISIASSSFSGLTPDQKRALYNYNFVVKDGSFGVHNTSYAVQLLQRAYFGITGRSFVDDFPNADLRGPVQAAVLPPEPTPVPGPTRTPTPDPICTSAVYVDILAASPRDVAADPGDVFDEVATGLHNVGVGEKMYLEAKTTNAAIVEYNWSIMSKPAGSLAELSDATGSLVTFRPDVKGNYVVWLTAPNPGSGFNEICEQTINVAEYAGVGIFTLADANSHPVAPQCGTRFCHGGNNKFVDLNVLDEWASSNHASVLQAHLSGERSGHYSTSCLPCHTTGFNAAAEAVNNGFDDRAAAIGYDLGQIPGLVVDAYNNGVDNFQLLPNELKSHASVQCESCHGPGSLHPSQTMNPDSGIAGVNLSAKQCAACHDSVSGFQQIGWQWENSAHSVATPSPSTRSGCVDCHTAEGFVSAKVKGLAGEVVPRPNAITCVACHDPHNSDNPHQLRVVGDTTLPSGDVTFLAGMGGMCFRCHNSRVADAEQTALTSYRGAHYGPQADMLIGVSGVGFGLPFAANSPHGFVVEDTCVACHMAEPTESGPGIITPPKVGAHTFSMRDTMGTSSPDDDVTNAANACSSCHIGLSTYDLLAKGDYDGNGVVEGVQTEVAGLIDLLRVEILANLAGTTDGGDHGISISSGAFGALNDTQKKVLYNYNFVVKDGSLGVHNTSYAVQLLQRSYAQLTGEDLSVTRPDMVVIGPVMEMPVDNTRVNDWESF